MNKDSKILIVGHDDIIERSLRSYFHDNGFADFFSSTVIGMNPTIQASVYDFFQEQRPEYVFLASTRSGGIQANKERGGEFMYHNLESQNNILYASHKFGVKKLLFFAGSCVYPKECPQPMSEECLLTGPLEETSAPYSVAKIAGIKLCQSFKSQFGFNAIVMVPANVYGPGSSTDRATAHVMGALIAKFSEAVEENKNKVTVWGTGEPRREFLYADDLVTAALFLMDHYDGGHTVNAGSGVDVSIKELSGIIAKSVGYNGKINFDTTKPDGAPQKLLDSSRINGLGWKAKVSLEEGISRTVQWMQKKQSSKVIK